MKNKHQLVWGVILFGALAVLIVYSSGLFLLSGLFKAVTYIMNLI